MRVGVILLSLFGCLALAGFNPVERALAQDNGFSEPKGLEMEVTPLEYRPDANSPATVRDVQVPPPSAPDPSKSDPKPDSKADVVPQVKRITDDSSAVQGSFSEPSGMETQVEPMDYRTGEEDAHARKLPGLPASSSQPKPSIPSKFPMLPSLFLGSRGLTSPTETVAKLEQGIHTVDAHIQQQTTAMSGHMTAEDHSTRALREQRDTLQARLTQVNALLK